VNNPSNPLAEPPHAPSLKEDDPNGLICFLNIDRPCEPTCMAWIRPPAGPDFQDQQFSNCMLLVNAHRAGKHLVVLASNTSALIKKAQDEAADRARTQPAPPVPR
jgi:hypothetical protein